VACPRHPDATTFRAYCPACLLEDALVAEPGLGRTRQLTIQVPLGSTTWSSVFLVRSEGPPSPLLRLKTWRRPADPGFLARFHRLRTELDSLTVDGIDGPLAASLDATGCPSVLSVFRQGIPILDRVRSGRLDREHAIARLGPLVAATVSAHARGLVHGSIVPGNVIAGQDSAPAWLLDFGHANLVAPSAADGASAGDVLAGFETLARTLREIQPNPASARRL
jgi:hypothetical protein